MRLDVIDLSHWQDSEPDFNKARAAGLVGVILKATEGTGYVDPTFAKRKTAAFQAYLPCASYHFLKHGNVTEQIQHYLATAKPAKHERVIIDYEDAGCTLADLRTAVTAIKNADSTLQITVYGGSKLKQELHSRDELLATTSLWLAQYTSGIPSWPKTTWPEYALWQYSDGHFGGQPRSMDGFVEPFDCNTYNGSQAECRAWFNGNLAAATKDQPANYSGNSFPVGGVEWLQTELNRHGAIPRLKVDGVEGKATQAATRAFAVEQLKKG